MLEFQVVVNRPSVEAMVRDILRNYPDMSIQSPALLALHTFGKAFLKTLMEEAGRCAAFAGRLEPIVRDVRLACRVMGNPVHATLASMADE